MLTAVRRQHSPCSEGVDSARRKSGSGRARPPEAARGSARTRAQRQMRATAARQAAPRHDGLPAGAAGAALATARSQGSPGTSGSPRAPRRCRADASGVAIEAAPQQRRESAAACRRAAARSRSRARSTSARVWEMVSPSNSALARQHLAQHHAERPDVGALVDRLARAPAPAPCRPPCRGSRPPRRRGHRRASASSSASTADAPAPGAIALARPKSSTFTVPSAPDLDVRRLQIAMDDALLVRGFERLGDLLRDRQRLVERHRPSRDASRERRPRPAPCTSAVAPSDSSRP